jgi:radical SAM protein with 4Fe4S-binding SPASM domain
MLPLPVLKRVIDDLPWSCDGVILWGGETLEYPDVVPLARHVRDSGRGCALVTNATFLAAHARGLVEAGVDVVGVSLDALEETHDRLRGMRGTFQAAIEGIRAVKTAREARGSRYPVVCVGVVLLPEAVEQLPELIRHVRAEGVDRVFIGRLQITTERQGKSHEAAFQKLFQIAAPSWKGFLRQPQLDGAEKIRAVVEQLRADPANRGFLQWETPSWSPQDFFDYYRNPTAASPVGRTCRFPWDAVSISPNGDVCPCPDFPDFVVGNVKDSSFANIWNSPRFAQFRRTLAEQGRFPVCTSCCHLYDDH